MRDFWPQRRVKVFTLAGGTTVGLADDRDGPADLVVVGTDGNLTTIARGVRPQF